MTERDPIDELGAALFSAARRERPRDDVRARALAAALAPPDGASESSVNAPAERGTRSVTELGRSRRFGVAMALAAVLAALVVGVILLRRHDEPVFAIGPERASRRDETLTPRSSPGIEKGPASLPSLPEAPGERTARPRIASHASHDAAAAAAAQKIEIKPPASLPDEIAALDRVRTDLAGGDSTAALRGLDDYDGVLHGTRLAAEATLLRIDALARSGRAAQASGLARHFVEANPGSALADRARAFIRNDGSLGVDAGG